MNKHKLLVQQASAFTRPSDYRRISLAADKLESKITEWDEQKNIDKISEKEEIRIDQQSIDYTRSRKSKTSLSAKQSESKKIDSLSESKSQKSSSLGTTRTEKKEEIPIEPVKKDMLDYLNKLSATVEWFVYYYFLNLMKFFPDKKYPSRKQIVKKIFLTIRTLEHVEGETLLAIPKIPELSNPDITDEALSSNKKIVEQLEEAVMVWGKHIQRVMTKLSHIFKSNRQKIHNFYEMLRFSNFQILDSYADRKLQGPMAEYDDWRDRETGLSILVEQLKTPIVKRILSILNHSLSTIGSAFDYFQIELWKYYTEARDNNKFLFTVLRYFKVTYTQICILFSLDFILMHFNQV